ncbi:MAG: cysteine hydrolase [Chloroflexi bacterium]|nr:cysteine hydrolase [Chloroflexota bacterium]
MPARNPDLHGNVPDTAAAALLLIDLINDFEYPGGDALFAQALPLADRLRTLKRRAKAAGIPVVYVNDNYGRWRSDFRMLVEHCLRDGVRGRPVVERLLPEPDDYFVLKPKHSGFYSTTLDVLLAYLRAETLLLTGVAGDVCVLFTAHDAFMRDFRLVVPADCVASIDPASNDYALARMRDVLAADLTPSTALDLVALARRTAPVQTENVRTP